MRTDGGRGILLRDFARVDFRVEFRDRVLSIAAHRHPRIRARAIATRSKGRELERGWSLELSKLILLRHEKRVKWKWYEALKAAQVK